MVRGTLSGLSTPLVVGGGHKRALMLLLVLLLDGTVGGTFVSVLVSFCLALEAVEDRSDCHLARGMAGGDVEELLGFFAGPYVPACELGTHRWSQIGKLL